LCELKFSFRARVLNAPSQRCRKVAEVHCPLSGLLGGDGRQPGRVPGLHFGSIVPFDDALKRKIAAPNSISAGASNQRMCAALGADVLEPAVDAAVTAQAANSIEKMLCHQMAGVHFAAMRLLEESATPNLPPGEVARFTNAAARLIDVYQSGCLTLQKLKTRGTQRVLVQYQQVNVGDGGQAVVAGRIGGGSRNRGKGGKNGR
jgi:hypothetical protein